MVEPKSQEEAVQACLLRDNPSPGMRVGGSPVDMKLHAHVPARETGSSTRCSGQISRRIPHGRVAGSPGLSRPSQHDTHVSLHAGTFHSLRGRKRRPGRQERRASLQTGTFHSFTAGRGDQAAPVTPTRSQARTAGRHIIESCVECGATFGGGGGGGNVQIREHFGEIYYSNCKK